MKSAGRLSIINGLPRRFFRHPLIRSAAIVAGGTAVAQIIGIASTPLLTRLYGPEAYGCLSLLIAASSVLLPIVNFSYSVAIVVPSRQCEAVRLFQLTLVLTAFTCSLFGAALGLIAAQHPSALTQWIGTTAYENKMFWLLVPLLATGGVTVCFQSWLVRAQAFRTLSTCSAIAAIFGSAAKIAGGLLHPGPWMLGATHTGATLFSALAMGWACVASVAPAMTECRQARPWTAEVLRAGYRYRDFPLYSMPRDILNGISAGFPSIMLATLGDIRVAGFYGLARTVLSVPAGLVTQSLSTVLLPHLAASSHAGKSLRPVLVKSMAVLLLIGLPIFGTLALAGPMIFRLVFGVNWVMAGVFASWLSLWALCTFVDLPCTHAIRFLGLQRFFLFHEISTTLARLAAVYIGLAWAKDAQCAVAALSLVGVAANIALVAWVLAVASRADAHATSAIPNDN